jgi:hypothetical protein
MTNIVNPYSDDAFRWAGPGPWQAVTVDRSLAYRLGRSLTLAAGAALSGALSLAVTAAVVLLLPYLLSGSLLQLIQALAVLAGLFAAVISFSGVFVSFGELSHNASLEIAPPGLLRFGDVNGETEVAFVEVSEIRASQPLAGQMFGYGTIEVFADGAGTPVIAMPGVRQPLSFKDWLDGIVMRGGAPLH